MKDLYNFRVRRHGDGRNWSQISTDGSPGRPLTFEEATDHARQLCRPLEVAEVRYNRRGSFQGHYMDKSKHDGPIKREECSFYRSMCHWQKLLDTTDPRDTNHATYLREKLSTAKAIVEARRRAGKYRPEGEL
jgi:hypothetical protein